MWSNGRSISLDNSFIYWKQSWNLMNDAVDDLIKTQVKHLPNPKSFMLLTSKILMLAFKTVLLSILFLLNLLYSVVNKTGYQVIGIKSWWEWKPKNSQCKNIKHQLNEPFLEPDLRDN